MELEARIQVFFLKIVHGNGATVPVTEVIAYLGAEGETVEAGASQCSSRSCTTTADLKATGLEVPAPPAVAPQAPKAELAADEYDMIVVGGGPMAYYHAIRGAQLGGKIAIVENQNLAGPA